MITLLLLIACGPASIHTQPASVQPVDDTAAKGAGTSADSDSGVDSGTLGDSGNTDTGATSPTDTGTTGTTDTGTTATGTTDTTPPEVCDPTISPKIVGVEYSCASDLWSVKWQIAGSPASVTVDFSDNNGMKGRLSSDFGDIAADCCEEPKYQISASCGGLAATLRTYDASGKQVDCVDFGAWGLSGCALASSTPLTCTP